MSHKFYEILKGEFSGEDWVTIRDALNDTAIQYEHQLSQQNAGDREWKQHDRIRAIINDIELFVLGGD